MGLTDPVIHPLQYNLLWIPDSLLLPFLLLDLLPLQGEHLVTERKEHQQGPHPVLGG